MIIEKSIKEKPISFTMLWQNLWVFSLYGIIVAVILGTMSSWELDLLIVEKLIMEPLSFYAFSALSNVGFLGLTATNLTIAKTGEAMLSSVWVRWVWLPIANTGLTSGAIIMGMMLGLSIGLLPWVSNPEIKRIAFMLFFMSWFVFAVLYPLALGIRSMFDTTENEAKRSVVLAFIYCIFVGISSWFLSSRAFWGYVVLVSLISVIIIFFMRRNANMSA